jgi:signal transduction histidine kinase
MFCPEYQPHTTFFIFSSAEFIPRILYYAFIPSIAISIFMGFFVFLKANKTSLSTLFLLICVSFSFYTINDLLTWVGNGQYVMLAWSYTILFYDLLFILFFIFFEIFVSKKGSVVAKRLWPILFFLPIAVVLPTNYYLEYVDITTCNVFENHSILIYDYCFTAFISLWILIRGLTEYYKTKDASLKKKIAILIFGISSFLVPFFLFSALASYNNYAGKAVAYDLEPYGLLGIPIFLGTIAYMIAKYRLFGIKLHEGKLLVIGLFIVVGSQLFYIRNFSDQIIVVTTFILAVIIGMFLIRNIKREEQEKRIELERINKELLKLDQAKSEFVNIASHQLRTPVTIIKGVISLIVSGKIEKFSSEEKERLYSSIWKKSKKLEDIIKDILNVASLTNKKYQISENSAEKINLKELVGEIVSDFKAESEQRGIDINFHSSENERYEIEGVKQDLKEVFNNLIINAFKYIPLLEDSLKGEINVNFEKKGIDIIVSVKDNGIGIPKDEIPKLFEKFYRASNAKKLYTDGSGLGLFIAKEIIKGHEGEIWIESELEKGTTVFVRLPIK